MARQRKTFAGIQSVQLSSTAYWSIISSVMHCIIAIALCFLVERPMNLVMSKVFG